MKSPRPVDDPFSQTKAGAFLAAQHLDDGRVEVVVGQASQHVETRNALPSCEKVNVGQGHFSRSAATGPPPETTTDPEGIAQILPET
jgi:hypothetical protein